MKKIVHKSVIPLYVVAATWLLYALLLPLNRISHYIVAVIVTALVGVVARVICPNRVEEVAVKEEPKTTGNPELDKMVDNCRKAIDEMKRLDINIEDETISAQIVRLEGVTGKIMEQVQKQPDKLPQIRKFMDYYLPTTLKLLNAYDRMSGQGVSGENISATIARVEGIMETIVSAFEKQLDSLFGSEAMDISTDISVLEQMMAREGLTEDGLHRAVNEQQEKKENDGGITLQL